MGLAIMVYKPLYHGSLYHMSHCTMQIFGAFLFLVSSNFLYFGGIFNKTIIPFALVGYVIAYS